MDSDKAKSAIDRLVGPVWDIEPGRTLLPAIQPETTQGIVPEDVQAGLMSEPETPAFEDGRPRKKSRARKNDADAAEQPEKSER